MITIGSRLPASSASLFGDTLGVEYARREPGEITIDFKVLRSQR